MVLALIAICIALPAQAVQLAGRVVGVPDGDTVDLLSENNVRARGCLSGIDAPEKSQPHGRVSKNQSSDESFGKSVVAEGSKHDKYGRLVARIKLAGRDITC